MLRITGLDGQGEYMMKAEDMRVDHPGALIIFILGMSTGVKNPGRTATFRQLQNGEFGL